MKDKKDNIKRIERRVSQHKSKAKEIDLETAEKLKVDGDLPAVVFSVDKKGEMQAYRIEGSKCDCCTFPLHSNDIKSMKTITLFESSNPKTCWLDTNGQMECIEW